MPPDMVMSYVEALVVLVGVLYKGSWGHAGNFRLEEGMQLHGKMSGWAHVQQDTRTWGGEIREEGENRVLLNHTVGGIHLKSLTLRWQGS